MTIRAISCLSLLVALAATRCLAAPRAADPANCGGYAEIPEKDVGTAPSGCDSNNLYYGKFGDGVGADYVGARMCAYRERAAKDDGYYRGATILMMIYANGLGVPRNIPLAKLFADEIGAGAAPAEIEGREKSLNDLCRENPRKSHFDICDDITSGMMMGVCADHAAGFEQAKRQRRVEALSSSWTTDQKRAFALLRKAADAWFEASTGNEVDLSGTARVAISTDAGELLENDFLKALERFEKGSPPEPGAAAFRTEDASLNAAYSAWIRVLTDDEKNAESIGTIRSQGVRESQRKWLAYREAWVAFGAARYPHVPADTWRAWLSHERAGMIKELASGG